MHKNGMQEFVPVSKNRFSEYVRVRKIGFAEYVPVRRNRFTEYIPVHKIRFAKYVQARQNRSVEYEQISANWSAEYLRVRTSRIQEYAQAHTYRFAVRVLFVRIFDLWGLYVQIMSWMGIRGDMPGNIRRLQIKTRLAGCGMCDQDRHIKTRLAGCWMCVHFMAAFRLLQSHCDPMRNFAYRTA